MPYMLRKDLYFCIASGQATFLDLAADRYFGLPSHLDALFQAWLTTHQLAPGSDIQLSPLVTAGILQKAEIGHPVAPPDLTTATHSVMDYPGTPGMPLPSLRALHNHFIAARRLKTQPLSSTIAHLRRQKARMQNSSEHSTGARALAHAKKFFAIGQFVATQDQCLRRSIALMDYLAAANCNSTFVMGVRRQPFGAHAWVQHNDLVLNDLVDHVCEYTPILAV